MQCWLRISLVAILAATLAQAQTAVFTRPGTMIVIGLVGEAVAVAGGQEKALKVDDRIRAEVVYRTSR